MCRVASRVGWSWRSAIWDVVVLSLEVEGDFVRLAEWRRCEERVVKSAMVVKMQLLGLMSIGNVTCAVQRMNAILQSEV